MKYRLKNKSYSIVERINRFSDISFKNPDVLKNPLGTKIENPEPGYAHVYFYYSGLSYKIKHNDEKLVKITPSSYYLHKIKIDETHKYLGNDLSEGKVSKILSWDILEESQEFFLEIFPKDQQVYIVSGKEKESVIYEYEVLMNSVKSSGIELVIDNGKVSKYALLSMKKKISE